jgi:hypothetical protein
MLFVIGLALHDYFSSFKLLRVVMICQSGHESYAWDPISFTIMVMPFVILCLSVLTLNNKMVKVVKGSVAPASIEEQANGQHHINHMADIPTQSLKWSLILVLLCVIMLIIGANAGSGGVQLAIIIIVFSSNLIRNPLSLLIAFKRINKEEEELQRVRSHLLNG